MKKWLAALLVLCCLWMPIALMEEATSLPEGDLAVQPGFELETYADPNDVSIVANSADPIALRESAIHNPYSIISCTYPVDGQNHRDNFVYSGTLKLEAELIGKGILKHTVAKLIKGAIDAALPGLGAKVGLIKTLHSILSAMDAILEADEGEYDDWIGFLDESIDALQTMTPEDYQRYVQKNEDQFSAIAEATGYALDTVEGMRDAQMAMRDGVSAGTAAFDGVRDILSRLSDMGYVPNGHIQDTYVMAINSKYAGYEGCMYLADDHHEIDAACTTVGPRCFYGNKTTQTVTIPDGVLYLAGSAFQNSTGLTELSVPETIEKLSMRVFSGCSNIEELTIPVNLSKDDYAFAGMAGVKTLRYTAGTTGVLADKYYNSTWHYEGTPEYLMRDSLTTIIIGEGITRIGSGAFYNYGYPDSNVTSITLPSTLQSIGSTAFCRLAGLTGTLALPEGLTEIGGSAFSSCTGFTGIKIPGTLEALPAYCFSGCTSLARVTVPKDSALARVEASAFSNCAPDLSFRGYADSYIQRFAVEQGYAFILLYEHLEPDFTLPAALTVIGEEAFEGCAFEVVLIQDGVTGIEARAFADCGRLAQVTIPASVTAIAEDAFEGVEALVIFCPAGSEAERFANAHGLACMSE